MVSGRALLTLDLWVERDFYIVSWVLSGEVVQVAWGEGEPHLPFHHWSTLYLPELEQVGWAKELIQWTDTQGWSSRGGKSVEEGCGARVDALSETAWP